MGELARPLQAVADARSGGPAVRFDAGGATRYQHVYFTALAAFALARGFSFLSVESLTDT